MSTNCSFDELSLSVGYNPFYCEITALVANNIAQVSFFQAAVHGLYKRESNTNVHVLLLIFIKRVEKSYKNARLADRTSEFKLFSHYDRVLISEAPRGSVLS